MAICIAGMHRSGTSMVAQLMNKAGAYLGPEKDLLQPASDNQEGFWESVHFVEMNERILNQFEAGWDLPFDFPQGWESLPGVETLKNDAARLVRQFDDFEPWAWKDPRNSLTLPFWESIIPNLKVLVCLRNPLEVALSLQARNFSSVKFGLNLWHAYNQKLVAKFPSADFVVTHYDSYFHDPQAELQRITSLIGLKTSSSRIINACLAALPDLRHQKVALTNLSATLPPDVFDCYLELCSHAGPVYEASHLYGR